MSHPDLKSQPREQFLQGAIATLPLIIGAIPFGIIFGTLAVTNGLSPWATMAMSLFVFAGSAQFIAVGLLAINTALPIIILTTFVVNLRHLLYAASLMPYVKHLSQSWRALLAFGLTDETYAAVAQRYLNTEQERPPNQHWFFAGSVVAMWSNWQLCTLIGISVGELIPNIEDWGLDFAMSVTFIGMVVAQYIFHVEKNTAKNMRSIASYLCNPMFISIVCAGIVAVITHPLPHKIGLILAAICGVIAGVIAENIQAKPARSTSK